MTDPHRSEAETASNLTDYTRAVLVIADLRATLTDIAKIEGKSAEGAHAKAIARAALAKGGAG